MIVKKMANLWFMVEINKWFCGEDCCVGAVRFDKYAKAKSFAFHWSKHINQNFSRIFIEDDHDSCFVRSYRNGFIAADAGFKQEALERKEGYVYFD